MAAMKVGKTIMADKCPDPDAVKLMEIWESPTGRGYYISSEPLLQKFAHYATREMFEKLVNQLIESLRVTLMDEYAEHESCRADRMKAQGEAGN